MPRYSSAAGTDLSRACRYGVPSHDKVLKGAVGEAEADLMKLRNGSRAAVATSDDLPLNVAVGSAIKAFFDDSRDVALASELMDLLLADSDSAKKALFLSMYTCALLAAAAAEGEGVAPSALVDALMSDIADQFD